jgi:hypothetical protein
VKSESSKRALAHVLFIMAVSILMGSIVLQVYAEPLFKEAVPSMNSNQCSIFLATVYLVASSLSSLILDKLGRKVKTTKLSLKFVGRISSFHFPYSHLLLLVLPSNYLYIFACFKRSRPGFSLKMLCKIIHLFG